MSAESNDTSGSLSYLEYNEMKILVLRKTLCILRWIHDANSCSYFFSHKPGILMCSCVGTTVNTKIVYTLRWGWRS